MRPSISPPKLPESAIHVPAGAGTLAGFRKWALSDEFPEFGRVSYIQGGLFIDMSPEEVDTHNKVKTEITAVISTLTKRLNLGEFFSDRILVTNVAADLSTEPDATFVSWQTYEAGRARLISRKKRPSQYIELQGTPDWVLEVVSQSSVEKDTRTLRGLYHRAGIPEYWIIDARADPIDFQILCRRRDRYVAASPRGGWRQSRVFGRDFHLDRQPNRLGRWEYTLRMTPD